MSVGTRLILDLGRTCRTCLVQKSTEELRSILENNLEKVLCEIANIQLNFHSSLPAAICTTCLKTLNLALDFRNQVHESESQLRTLIYSLGEPDPIAPITVIYKSLAVLESPERSEECERRTEGNKEKKYDECEKVLIIDNSGNAQSCFQECNENAGGKKVVDNIEVYAISAEITDTGDSISYFVSDDDDGHIGSAHLTKNKPETLNTNKSAIFINGSLSNVIKWADSENNSVSLSHNFTQSNQGDAGSEIAIPKGGSVAEQALKTITENTEIIESKVGNIEKEKTESDDRVKKMTNFSCTLCSKKFRYEFGYRAHCTKHGISMVCKLCQATFDDSNKYLVHTKTNHPDFKPFSCPNCDKHFAVMSTLKKHYVYHLDVTKPRKFPCDTCNKRFSQQNLLVSHKRSHSGQNPYQCDTCNKNFSGAHSLRNHLKIHRGEKKHKCSVCEARFIHRFSLRAHLRTHSGEKPFVCQQCNNRFSTSSYLKIHMRTHTSEKPYTCVFCDKNFVSRCALAAHEKSHTGEKKYQCDVCGWRSTRLADLQTHIRTHTGEKPYFCDQCDKSYKTSSNLAAHKKTHLGLKEHVCHVCNKAFGDPRTLKGHIRIHTGETPYQCHICGHRFKQSGQLSAHRKTHRN